MPEKWSLQASEQASQVLLEAILDKVWLEYQVVIRTYDKFQPQVVLLLAEWLLEKFTTVPSSLCIWNHAHEHSTSFPRF